MQNWKEKSLSLSLKFKFVCLRIYRKIKILNFVSIQINVELFSKVFNELKHPK